MFLKNVIWICVYSGTPLARPPLDGTQLVV